MSFFPSRRGSVTGERRICMTPVGELLTAAQRALDYVTSQREEDCWCYDEVDGTPDAKVKAGRCLACHLRQALAAADPSPDPLDLQVGIEFGLFQAGDTGNDQE
jgi:hypothetical protein